VAVLGVDNDSQVCELSNPPLSSVALSVERAGFEAAAILGKLMSGKKVSVKSIVADPIEVARRHSTDTTAIDDIHVVKALQFINQNDKKLIQVSDVLRVTGCSRRSLDEKFYKYIGSTVFSEIRRVRIEKISQMLLETNLTISQIALSLGYNDSDHIARFFRQEKNMTPRAYREKFGTGKSYD
jgi:LacI family transcriptional regulator